jgi:hypothetical protein
MLMNADRKQEDLARAISVPRLSAANESFSAFGGTGFSL